MGDVQAQGFGFRVEGSATVLPAAAPPPPGPVVIRGHVVCRDADGRIKWEADTVPVTLGVNADAAPIRLELAPPAPAPCEGAER